MMEPDRAKPPAAWLGHLREAGHWDRLIEIASQSLAIDPNDLETHRHIAWAYASTNRLPELASHFCFLLDADPDDPRHHHLAAVYYLDSRRHKQAAPHIETLLHDCPNSATYHYLACIYALRTKQMKKAHIHIEHARALAPDWPPAEHLQIRMSGIGQRKAREAWDRIRRLKLALAHDPQDAAMITTIGEIFLIELERHRDAELFFREALRIESGNSERQALLLQSIRARSLLYRTLSLPMSAGRRVLKAWHERRIRWFYVIIGIKGVLIFIAWVLLVGAFFSPAAKVYEWLVLSDIPRTRPPSRWLAPLGFVFAWPLWLRMVICSAIIAGAWALFLDKICGLALSDVSQVMGWVFGIHFGLVCLVVGARRLRARYGQWQETRRSGCEANHALETSLG